MAKELRSFLDDPQAASNQLAALEQRLATVEVKTDTLRDLIDQHRLYLREQETAPITPLANSVVGYGGVYDSETWPVWKTENGYVFAPTTNVYAIASRTDVQSVAAGSFQRISYNTENEDPRGDYDNVTNFRYTAPVAGLYWCSVSCEMSLTLTTQILVASIFVNSAEVRRGSRGLGNGSGATNSICVGLLRLAAAAYVEGAVIHTGPNPTNTTTTAGANMFQIHLISIG